MGLSNPLTTYRGDYRYLKKKIDVACLSGDAVGDPVYIRGQRVNGKLRVAKADPEDRLKMPAIGILISKSTPTVGVVQMFGPCDIFSSLSINENYFVGKTGITNIVPVIGVDGYSMVQVIGITVSDDLLMMNGNVSMIVRRS